MAALPARFLFDLDFAAPRPPEPLVSAAPPEPVVPMIELERHHAELAAAVAAARDEGYAAGRAAGEVRAADRLADEAARLVAAARTLLGELDADRLKIEREAVELAVAVARKLARGLVDREPLAEIIALISECLGPLRKAPHLVLRLASADSDGLKAHVDRLARENGFDGRVVILGEPDLPRGDCRIEWADGGIIRDSAALNRDIQAAVDRYLGARAREADANLTTEPAEAGGRH